jgi:hypothetical protein
LPVCGDVVVLINWIDINFIILELVTGAKTQDVGVKNAMFKALFEVVSKAGSNMNEASRSSILGLIDGETGDDDGECNCFQFKIKDKLTKWRFFRNH